MVTRESPGRTRLLASGLLALTLVAGALGGVATERAFANRRTQPTQPPRAGAAPERGRMGGRIPSIFLDTTMYGRIGATAEQRQKIESILAYRDREATRLWMQIKPSVDSLVKTTRADIRNTLSEEQRQQLDQIFRERYERQRREGQRNDDSNKPKP